MLSRLLALAALALCACGHQVDSGLPSFPSDLDRETKHQVLMTTSLFLGEESSHRGGLGPHGWYAPKFEWSSPRDGVVPQRREERRSGSGGNRDAGSTLRAIHEALVAFKEMPDGNSAGPRWRVSVSFPNFVFPKKHSDVPLEGTRVAIDTKPRAVLVVQYSRLHPTKPGHYETYGEPLTLTTELECAEKFLVDHAWREEREPLPASLPGCLVSDGIKNRDGLFVPTGYRCLTMTLASKPKQCRFSIKNVELKTYYQSAPILVRTLGGSLDWNEEKNSLQVRFDRIEP